VWRTCLSCEGSDKPASSLFLQMPLRTAQSAAACTDWNMAGLLLSTPIMCGSAAAAQDTEQQAVKQHQEQRIGWST
jgi:hypothetical protein